MGAATDAVRNACNADGGGRFAAGGGGGAAAAAAAEGDEEEDLSMAVAATATGRTRGAGTVVRQETGVAARAALLLLLLLLLTPCAPIDVGNVKGNAGPVRMAVALDKTVVDAGAGYEEWAVPRLTLARLAQAALVAYNGTSNCRMSCTGGAKRLPVVGGGGRALAGG